MIKIINNMINFVDPEHPSMGATIKFFKITLLWAPSRNKYQNILYYFMLLLATILILSQFINLTIERHPFMFLTFLQYTAFHLGIVKLITFEFYHKKWEKIVQWISDKENQVMSDPNCKKAIDNYTKHGRERILFHLVMGIICNIVFFPRNWFILIKDLEFDGRLEIREKAFYFLSPSLNNKLSLYLYMFVQNLYGDITTVYVLAWDALCNSVLVAFAGQLKVVGERFRQALDAETEAEQKKNLIACHKHYISLLEAQKNCNDILSPALFTHLLVISVNFSVIIANMSNYSQSEILTFSLFMIGLLTETFLYYWHGNEVTVQSETVSYSVFESAWVDKSVEIKRLVMLMSMTTTKRLLFTAGPFNEVSLSTFVAILRATYSFYTFMAETR